MALARCGGSDFFLIREGSVTVQSGFDGDLRVPLIMGGPLVVITMSQSWWMASLFLVNTAVHWASQSWPTERRDPEAKLWKTCACFDACGRLAIGKVAVFLECMNWPFGS